MVAASHTKFRKVLYAVVKKKPPSVDTRRLHVFEMKAITPDETDDPS